MALGVTLNENVKIELGENRQTLLEKLENEEIRYRIMYDKKNKDGDLETIINISEYDTELQLYNSIVYSTRTYNNQYNNIYKHGERYGTPYKFLARVKDVAKRLCDGNDITLDVEKIDLGTMQCRFIVREDGLAYKISSTRDAHGNIYIGNMRLYLDT